jgi:molecular chaperone GrpE
MSDKPPHPTPEALDAAYQSTEDLAASQDSPESSLLTQVQAELAALQAKSSELADQIIKDATAEQIREGAQATLRQLIAALERNKVMAIAPAAGAKFDPHQHQAISVVPSDQDANTVVGLLQKGYMIADRVLRPALVTVSAPK